MSLVLIVVLIILLVGSLPHYPYSMGWGYAPSSVLGLVLVIVLIVLLVRGL